MGEEQNRPPVMVGTAKLARSGLAEHLSAPPPGGMGVLCAAAMLQHPNERTRRWTVDINDQNIRDLRQGEISWVSSFHKRNDHLPGFCRIIDCFAVGHNPVHGGG